MLTILLFLLFFFGSIFIMAVAFRCFLTVQSFSDRFSGSQRRRRR